MPCSRTNAASVTQFSLLPSTTAREFEPAINWETQAFAWTEFGNWPEPAHFGLTALLAHEESLAILRQKVLAAVKRV